MIRLFLFLFSLSAFADEPLHWAYVQKVEDRHEFYKNSESIRKPKDSWQTLFSLVYVNKRFQKLKDCIYYRVPGRESGILKIKTLTASQRCETFLLLPGDNEISQIKSLQFIIGPKKVILHFSGPDFRAEQWEAEVQNNAGDEPAMSMSSAEFKSGKSVLLAPAGNSSLEKEPLLKDGTLCHEINDDCEEVNPSSCSDCLQGWHEIPNGCAKGPKYCGVLKCGKKGEPACRRGLVWQKTESTFDCRIDSSFAYCSKGATIACEGRKAWCR